MTRKFFGTDGIRGPANGEQLTPGLALRLGMAVGRHFGAEGRVLIGKDTRRSGYMFENALSAGLCAVGCDVMLLGPMPTPAVAYLTRSMRANAGVVISASHNPFEDNGFKIFGSNGFKLPDEVEAELERSLVPGALESARATGAAIGRAKRIDDAAGRYITKAKQAYAPDRRLDGLHIVLDCAHGAGYRVAPTILEELGAKLSTRGIQPNGTNINDGVGALHPASLAEQVLAEGADLGIALDGDADRVVMVDGTGAIVDGDDILAILGLERARERDIGTRAVVGTVMSNLGLERVLERAGIELMRAPVGDRYVVERMRTYGVTLGGEPSGHIVCLDHGTSGDGLVTALQILSVMTRRECPLAELRTVMKRVPQVTKSYRVARKLPLDELPKTTKAIAGVRDALLGRGRVLVRYSGTEAKIRVMCEGDDAGELTHFVEEIGDVAVSELRA